MSSYLWLNLQRNLSKTFLAYDKSLQLAAGWSLEKKLNMLACFPMIVNKS